MEEKKRWSGWLCQANPDIVTKISIMAIHTLFHIDHEHISRSWNKVSLLRILMNAKHHRLSLFSFHFSSYSHFSSYFLLLLCCASSADFPTLTKKVLNIRLLDVNVYISTPRTNLSNSRGHNKFRLFCPLQIILPYNNLTLTYILCTENGSNMKRSFWHDSWWWYMIMASSITSMMQMDHNKQSH